MRSKMCDNGRQARQLSLSLTRSASTAAATLDQMLPCVSITPLGVPVVPEV